MTIFVSIKDLEEQLTELTAKVEAGETVVVTQAGRPVFDLKPHREAPSLPESGGINYERGRAHLASLGIADPFPRVADDFDDPLPEDFLVRPLPSDG